MTETSRDLRTFMVIYNYAFIGALLLQPWRDRLCARAAWRLIVVWWIARGSWSRAKGDIYECGVLTLNGEIPGSGSGFNITSTP